jgi:hypothetical protein
MSGATSEFVQKLMTLIAKTGTGQVHSDALAKLINGFVRSIDVEKKAEKKAKKEANKESKKNGKKNMKEKSDMDKPLNAYMLYCIKKRPSIVEVPENKGKPPKEITSILAREWRKERDQKSQFVEMLQQEADEASLKYKQAKEKANETKEKDPSTPLKKEKGEKKEKAPNAPKKKKAEKAPKKAKKSGTGVALDFSEQ